MQQHIEMLQNLPSKASQLAIEAIVLPAANKLIARELQRIVNEGKNSDGSKRSGYSTKPIYASQKQFVAKGAFKPQGKVGKTKKNGQPNKSMYLPGGYDQFRSIQGRRTDIKNYELSGDLVKDFDLQSQPEQGRVLIGFRSEKQSLKRKGLEKRNGAAFPPSQEEIQEYKDEVTQESRELQIKIMTNVI